MAATEHKVRWLVMDVDGTLTDGKVYIGPSGEVFKAFDIKDGLGIHEILPELGIVPVVITGRSSAMLERRCVELGIAELHQGVSDKLSKLREIVERGGGSLADVAYIGDDLNDLACMRAVQEAGGVTGCPSDAAGSVARICGFVVSRPGGSGAVREFIEWLGRNAGASIDSSDDAVERG